MGNTIPSLHEVQHSTFGHRLGECELEPTGTQARSDVRTVLARVQADGQGATADGNPGRNGSRAANRRLHDHHERPCSTNAAHGVPKGVRVAFGGAAAKLSKRE